MVQAVVGCAGADVAVSPTRLPVPVVERLPVSVGIFLSQDLLGYVHEEELTNNGRWRIDVGTAQPLMFDNIARGLFSDHRRVENLEQVPSGVDAVLIPSIAQLQFAIPAQTRSDFFEVWIRYQFELLDADGSRIAQWPMEAYGRANARNYGFMEDTENGALQEAAQIALRDAMAFFTFKFQRVPAVARWLQSVAPPTQSAAAPAAGST